MTSLMLLTEAVDSTAAGVITALGTSLIAVGGVITAIGVLIPILRGTRKNTATIDENQKVTVARLAVIHTLVNSTLTAALQSELEGARREELLLRELIQMRTDVGHAVTDDQTAALGAIQRRISELTAATRDRAEQTRAADMQIENERDRRSSAEN